MMSARDIWYKISYLSLLSFAIDEQLKAGSSTTSRCTIQVTFKAEINSKQVST